MPNKPRRACTTPGCPNPVENGRCARCQANRRRHETGRDRSYKTGQWTRFRIDYLLRHPACTLCGRLANTPDHHPVSRRELVARGVANPDQDCYVRPLCNPCHGRETAKHQPGGWVTHQR